MRTMSLIKISINIPNLQNVSSIKCLSIIYYTDVYGGQCMPSLWIVMGLVSSETNNMCLISWHHEGWFQYINKFGQRKKAGKIVCGLAAIFFNLFQVESCFQVEPLSALSLPKSKQSCCQAVTYIPIVVWARQRLSRSHGGDCLQDGGLLYVATGRSLQHVH